MDEYVGGIFALMGSVPFLFDGLEVGTAMKDESNGEVDVNHHSNASGWEWEIWIVGKLACREEVEFVKV